MDVRAQEHKTVKETAEAWGVSKRWVNMCIESGRISGVVRMGNMWLVPKDAQKPADLRRGNPTPRGSYLPASPEFTSDFEHLMSNLDIWVPRASPFSVLDSISEESVRLFIEGAFGYARGDFALAIKNYKQNKEDDAGKLCASGLAIAAAISLGDYPFYSEVETFLKGVIQANISAGVTAYAELSLSAAYLGSLAPIMVPGWLKEGDFAVLPRQARVEAAHMRALYLQCIGEYQSMLDVARTTLAFCGSRHDMMAFSEMYLMLMCAVACHALGREEDARRWLLDAMNIYLPHGFITPFAELVPAFGGMMEQLLEQKYPAFYGPVIEGWKRTHKNWLTFHNQFTKRNVTLILSLREYEIAALVVRRVPYETIAKQYGISVGRLKNILREIYGKLFVSGRDELAQYVLTTSYQ